MRGPSGSRPASILAPRGFLALCLAGLTMVAVPAFGEDTISVDRDYVRIIKLDRAVNRVIIGNADIADVTISDPQTIVLTGKSAGTTNLVILDLDGNAIVDRRILVSLENKNTMHVYRQTNRSLLSCTPGCEMFHSQ